MEFDKSLSKINLKADRIGDSRARQCRVCGKGKYLRKSDGNPTSTKNFGGLEPRGSNKIMLFRCDYCGNLQLFHYEEKDIPGVWENKT